MNMPDAVSAQRDADAGVSFRLLTDVFGDAETRRLWSESRAIDGWIRFEVALAQAQSEVGIVPATAAEAIARTCRDAQIDRTLLQMRTRSVGYPILPLLEQLGQQGGDIVDRYIHWGATTQDAMDTGLALQLAASLDRQEALLSALGDRIEALMHREVASVMLARTHAQHAVPTTFGAKLAVILAELTRHRERVRLSRERVAVVSMFGAGGTGAAYGKDVGTLRTRVAELLNLGDCAISWHSCRDSLAESVWNCIALTATCAKIGREVIELSRPEISEVREGGGRLKGASSTMPQKANPIASEVLVGLAGASSGYSQSASAFMVAGHERSAGEWQIEWDVVPAAFIAVASALATACDLMDNLEVDRHRMELNLQSNGLVMAESAMMQLAPTMGRHQAHDLVYDSCVLARETGKTLDESIAVLTRASSAGGVTLDLQYSSYLGEAADLVAAAARGWSDPEAGIT